MIEIELTKNKKTIVDDEFSHLVSWKWCAGKRAKNFYAVRNFRRDDGKWTRMYLHHAIVGRPLNGLEVDHIDGNGLNNQLGNLRIVTHRQNACNQPDRREGKTTSSFPGVSWKKSNKKWQVRIEINGKLKHLGLFLREEEASKAYERKVKELNLIGLG
jgi:hypothetical protein